MVDSLRAERRERVISGQLIIFAGLGALLSGAVLLLAVILFNNKVAQMVIFSISPLALIPVIPVFYRFHSLPTPSLNKLSLAIAGIGVAPILMMTFLAAIQRLSGSYVLPSGSFSSSMLRVG